MHRASTEFWGVWDANAKPAELVSATHTEIVGAGSAATSELLDVQSTAKTEAVAEGLEIPRLGTLPRVRVGRRGGAGRSRGRDAR